MPSPPSRRRFRLGVSAHTSPERKRRDSGSLGKTGNDCRWVGFRFHADWDGKQDPLRRGVPRLASGAFMGRRPGVGFGLA